VLETPGHTPEHVCYTIVDTDRSELPVVMLTGGDLLVGSVGRPDLLGKELGEQLAPQLYDSLLHKILSHDDFVSVLPTHGAGSSCGANISKTRTSTIGYERRTNPFLQKKTKDEFVEFVLSGQPAIPGYYSRMRPANQQGPQVLGRLPEPRAMSPDELEKALAGGSVLIDGRMPSAFGGAHIAGAYNIGVGPNFSTWVGSVLPPDRPIVLVVEHPAEVAEGVHQLIRIGYEQIEGYLAGGIDAWLAAASPWYTFRRSQCTNSTRRLNEMARRHTSWTCAPAASGTRVTSPARCIFLVVSCHDASTSFPGRTIWR
jgi:hydroxyacylglutathione hydrolase